MAEPFPLISHPQLTEPSLAQETPREKIQIVTIHPGLVYNDEWKAMGFAEEWFEDGKHSSYPFPVPIPFTQCLPIFNIVKLLS